MSINEKHHIAKIVKDEYNASYLRLAKIETNCEFFLKFNKIYMHRITIVTPNYTHLSIFAKK